MLHPVYNFIGRRPVLVAAICIALFLVTGCVGRVPANSAFPAPRTEHQADENPAAKVRRLEGDLRQAKLERDDARLEGARRLLNWCTGILVLAAVGGVVAGIFMKSKTLFVAAAACLAGAAAAQVFQQALDHIRLISWLSLAALLVVGGWMVWRYHKD